MAVQGIVFDLPVFPAFDDHPVWQFRDFHAQFAQFLADCLDPVSLLDSELLCFYTLSSMFSLFTLFLFPI